MTRQEHNEQAVIKAAALLKESGVQQYLVFAADFAKNRKSLQYGARKMNCTVPSLTAIIASEVVDWAEHYRKMDRDITVEDILSDIRAAVEEEVERRERE